MAKPKFQNNTKYKQGFYEVMNMDKYIGNPSECIYRSSWELKFMIYCDNQEFITKWGSETTEIPYVDAAGVKRRYYPDFYLEIIDPLDPCGFERVLVEVKPDKQTKMPVMGKTKTIKAYENFEYDLKAFQKNLAKWAFAKKWCDERYIKFIILTEEHLEIGNIL